MATPSKAYTDPTFLSKLSSAESLGLTQQAPAIPCLPSLNPQAGRLFPAFGTPRTVLPCLGPIIIPGQCPVIPVPTPPLGRQIIVTFPSIYKEKSVYTFNYGQFYPPPAP